MLRITKKIPFPAESNQSTRLRQLLDPWTLSVRNATYYPGTLVHGKFTVSLETGRPETVRVGEKRKGTQLLRDHRVNANTFPPP